MTGRGQSVNVERQPKDRDQWKANGKCTKRHACSLRHDESKREKSTRWSSPSPKTPTKSEENSATGRSLPGVSTFGKRHRRPCKDYLDGNCTNPSCDSWDPPLCQSYCMFLKKCLFLQYEADHQLNKRPKKGVRKGSVGLSKKAMLLNCVFQKLIRRNSSRCYGGAKNPWDPSAACNLHSRYQRSIAWCAPPQQPSERCARRDAMGVGQ